MCIIASNCIAAYYLGDTQMIKEDKKMGRIWLCCPHILSTILYWDMCLFVHPLIFTIGWTTSPTGIDSLLNIAIVSFDLLILNLLYMIVVTTRVDIHLGRLVSVLGNCHPRHSPHDPSVYPSKSGSSNLYNKFCMTVSECHEQSRRTWPDGQLSLYDGMGHLFLGPSRWILGCHSVQWCLEILGLWGSI